MNSNLKSLAAWDNAQIATLYDYIVEGTVNGQICGYEIKASSEKQAVILAKQIVNWDKEPKGMKQ